MIRTALVTGANGALGQQVVHRFIQDGHRVIATGRQKEPTFQVSNPSLLTWIEMDLTRQDEIERQLSQSKDVDYLIHCAGGFKYMTTAQVTEKDFDQLIDLNLRSAFYLAKKIIPEMKTRNYGRVVFVSAKATLSPPAGMGLYTASKSGLNALVSALAEEVKEHNINVNAVLPSLIDTPQNRGDMPKADFSKWVKPQAIAEIIYSLTQTFGDPIHGALLPISGRV